MFPDIQSGTVFLSVHLSIIMVCCQEIPAENGCLDFVYCIANYCRLYDSKHFDMVVEYLSDEAAKFTATGQSRVAPSEIETCSLRHTNEQFCLAQTDMPQKCD